MHGVEQGLVAGLNAARSARGGADVVFSRSNSYIGVMIDDLVTRGVTEPYRMFTSRAEFRLSLRADNADQRLTGSGIALGCVGAVRQKAFDAKMEALEAGRAALEALSLTPREASEYGITVGQDGQRRTGFRLLSFPGVTFTDLERAAPELATIPTEIKEQLARDATYATYIDRQSADVEAMRREEAHEIPDDFDYMGLTGLSNELKGKLSLARPRTLAQAGRIDGMTPAALTLILASLRRSERQRSAG